MNAAYKWYSYNSNIVQFYSDYSQSGKSGRTNVERVQESVDQTYNYANTLITDQPDININY